MNLSSNLDGIPSRIFDPYYKTKFCLLTRDIRSNLTLCFQEFPKASPLGTAPCKQLYLTVYPSSRPNTICTQWQGNTMAIIVQFHQSRSANKQMLFNKFPAATPAQPCLRECVICYTVKIFLS